MVTKLAQEVIAITLSNTLGIHLPHHAAGKSTSLDQYGWYPVYSIWCCLFQWSLSATEKKIEKKIGCVMNEHVLNYTIRVISLSKSVTRIQLSYKC